MVSERLCLDPTFLNAASVQTSGASCAGVIAAPVEAIVVAVSAAQSISADALRFDVFWRVRGGIEEDHNLLRIVLPVAVAWKSVSEVDTTAAWVLAPAERGLDEV